MTAAVLLLLSLLLSCISNSEPQKLPNIVHVVADDLGWADVGYRDSQVISPTIDELANSGVILQRFYVFKECAPSRGSIMTGRYPANFGYYKNPTDLGNVPLNFTLLPDLLRSKKGYATHAIGKWHLGFHSDACTPTYRGFDSFFGYYHADEDYYTHVFPPKWNHHGPFKCQGIDFNNSTGKNVHVTGNKFNETYSAFLFTDVAERIISTHPEEKPLYLYLAYQNCHGPLQAPERFIAKYPHVKPKSRRTYCGMISALDEGIQNVTRALKQKGLWENTIFLFQTDNGGPIGAARNYPLRGGKFTLWEGGLRGNAFITGPLVPKSARGTKWHGLMHESDWYPTLLSLANITLPSYTGPRPVDGYNMWSAAMSGSHSPRHEILHQPNNQWNNASVCTHPELRQKHSCGGAFMKGGYKLVFGYAGNDVWGPDPTVMADPNVDQSHSDWYYTKDGTGNDEVGHGVPPPSNAPCVEHPCLFNVFEDPEERNDISRSHRAKYKELLDRFEKVSAGTYPGVPFIRPGPKECEVVHSTGSWQPWD
eukprot:TRINITY_DN6568_c0_g1_i1.p1 TRINITY_DN6568_c0_g1~~TRINITY_DN6568_c0_g1_i1.p1  ORF type:complete len:550 (+),score=34.63 TRINITY_DN6568_c0_g1_i1:42-1652(+)